jgi:uncharacterized protein
VLKACLERWSFVDRWMERILFWVALLYLGPWLWRKYMAKSRGPVAGSGAPGGADPSGRSAGVPRLAEPMVRCPECGTHSPISDTILMGNQRFCNADHARRYAARPVGRESR